MSENPSVHITRRFKELYYDRFTDLKKEKLFDRMIDLFLLAASIGYKRGKEKKPIKADSDSPFKWSNFNKSDIALIKSICLMHKEKNPQVLLDNEKMMEIIENFAEGGIEEVSKMLDKEGNKAINLLEFINEHNIGQLLNEASSKES